MLRAHMLFFVCFRNELPTRYDLSTPRTRDAIDEQLSDKSLQREPRESSA